MQWFIAKVLMRVKAGDGELSLGDHKPDMSRVLQHHEPLKSLEINRIILLRLQLLYIVIIG